MVNTKNKTTQDMIDKVQQLIGEGKIKFWQLISKYYDEMNYKRQSVTFQFEEDVFSKGAQGRADNTHEV